VIHNKDKIYYALINKNVVRDKYYISPCMKLLAGTTIRVKRINTFNSTHPDFIWQSADGNMWNWKKRWLSNIISETEVKLKMLEEK